MFGDYFMKMMFRRQLKGLPQNVQDSMMAAFEKNPQFFKDLVSEITAKVKNGIPQATAVQQVMMSKRGELQKMLTEAHH